jgi:exonuclease SbcC
MRPLKLTMSAFGPFAGTQTIDFASLGDASFFLVHGKTGAGKTTIFDAICYALYNETSGGERSGEQMRSDFADPATRTGVILDFAVGGERYRVERVPRQERPAKRGAKMVTDPGGATLWRRGADLPDDREGEPVEIGHLKVTGEVERILGFSADRFRKVIVLPQGRFRDLLAADSKARQEILEQLFEAGLYGGFEQFLKDRSRGIGGRIDTLVTKAGELLDSQGMADDAALGAAAAGAREALDRAGALLAGIRAEAATKERALRVGEELARLHEEARKGAALAIEAEEETLPAESAARAAAEALEAETAREPERVAVDAEIVRLEQITEQAGQLVSARAALEGSRAAAATAVKRGEEAEQAAAQATEKVEAARRAGAEKLQVEARLEAAQGKTEQLRQTSRSHEELLSVRRRIAEAEERIKELGRREAETGRRLAEARTAAESLQARSRAGRAGLLATELAEGEPCPVCGSTSHPRPAPAAGEIPDDNAVDAAWTRVEAIDRQRSETGNALAAARTGFLDAGEWLDRLMLELGDLAEDEPEIVLERLEVSQAETSQLTSRAKELSRLARSLPDAEAEGERAAAAVAEARSAAEEARGEEQRRQGEVSAIERRIPGEFLAPESIRAALAEARGGRERLIASFLAARTRDAASKEALAAARAKMETARERREAAERAVAGRPAPDLGPLRDDHAAAVAALEAAVAVEAGRSAEAKRLDAATERLNTLRREETALREEAGPVALLAERASGGNPLKVSFQRYVLGVFLDEVLEAASRRLSAMSRGRYTLYRSRETGDKRMAGGLDLVVSDTMTGEDRPSSTLSGGEGFLAALALALGLAEVVQNLSGGIRLDAVFIDEGFGSLDPEALDAALDTLMTLREHGRLVGVISHVPELRERIDCRLEVTQGNRGSSVRLIVP